MKAIGDVKFCNKFLAGMRACREGEACPAGASKEFERGYGAQYEVEQQRTNQSMKAVRQ